MAKWARRGGRRRQWVWQRPYEVSYDGEAGSVPQRGGNGHGDGLAEAAGVESCAAVVLEAADAAQGEAAGEAGVAIDDE